MQPKGRHRSIAKLGLSKSTTMASSGLCWHSRLNVVRKTTEHTMSINGIRLFAFATVVTAVVGLQPLRASVVNITSGSTSGYTMTGGNTYIIQNSVEFSNSNSRGSGMSVADNATVVLYVPNGVTLTTTGANGSGQTGGGAGIYIPKNSTLVITGEGSVNATGGNGGNGTNGANGSKGGTVSRSSNRVKGNSGKGGAGGKGGGGAGAGIGGYGGTGGNGGSEGNAVGKSSYCAVTDFVVNGAAGKNGSDGTSGSDMGVCYVIGKINLSATSGKSGTRGNAGNFGAWTQISFTYNSTNYYAATCGGGGGGGGGAGSKANSSIGGGGSAGGGGGGGGSGAVIFEDGSTHYQDPMKNAHGGGGKGGISLSSSGATGEGTAGTYCGCWRTSSNLIGAGTGPTRHAIGGSGGEAGAAGAQAGAGTLYVSPTANVDVDRSYSVASTHNAAQYVINFNANEGVLPSPANSVAATLGCELPDLVELPFRYGYLFQGWVDENGVQYYDANGGKMQPCYVIPRGLTLYAVWVIDPDQLVIPESELWKRENAQVGWFVDAEASDGENEILRSGAIESGTNSWMEATLVGPASFSFDWRVSCNTDGHFLRWSLDGVEQAMIKGDTDWTTFARSVGEGEHKIKFDYVKGSTGAAGEDKAQVRNFRITEFIPFKPSQANVVNITSGSTSGYTMTDGKTYVIRNSVEFSNSNSGGSGMSVADNATVVLYVPNGVTLTTTGTDGSGRTGGGAGIYVPETATLIITGEGTVNATGGKAGDGDNGENGEAANDITTTSAKEAKGNSGAGGRGGNGGGGAGAGIGGSGGYGGYGGYGGQSCSISSLTTSIARNGKPGSDGGAGTVKGMGNVYVLGYVSIIAKGGLSGHKGAAGTFGRGYMPAAGGGGGGGGGAGGIASGDIGSGGRAGGGGGGGGSGGWDYYDYHDHIHGGSGYGGRSTSQNGDTGDPLVESHYGLGYKGGEGGAGGSAGPKGTSGNVYVSSNAVVDAICTYSREETHSAAQYKITFMPDGHITSDTIEVIATLGGPLPYCADKLFPAGYKIKWVNEDGICFYSNMSVMTLTSYPIPSDVTLHAVWEIDEDKAVAPNNAFWIRENAQVGWFVDTEASDGENEILRSGAIESGTNSWMEATLVGPASFSFDWRVSCNTRGHYLAWSLDGVEQARIKGDTDWAAVSRSVGEGEHKIKFDYVKGSTGAAGEDKAQVRNFYVDPVRIQNESMKVLLDWTTNYWVKVTTVGYGVDDFDSGWIADGSNLVVNLTSTIHSFKVTLSGDTQNVRLNGMQLEIPITGAARNINVVIEEVKPHLVVSSPQGMSNPNVGEHEYPSDAEVVASAIAPDQGSGIRAVCVGWTGTGSVPASGTGSSVTFCITNDSTIVWNWTTDYMVDFSIVGEGASSFQSQWVPAGMEITIPFTVNTPFYSLAISGDVDGVNLCDGSLTLAVTSPRSIVLTITEYTYKTALDDALLEWKSGGAAVWEAQTAVSHDGQDAVKSGCVSGDDVSVISTAVLGEGTLSWWWMIDMAGCAGVDVFVDESLRASLDVASGWTQKSVDITGDGIHSVKFEFWNAGTDETIADTAYLDGMSWNGKTPTATYTGTCPVPYAWLNTNAKPFVMNSKGDYEAAANELAANGVNKVWECYVSGISPTNAADTFVTEIAISNNVPYVTWMPDLNEGGKKTERVYRVWGSESLSPASWHSPTNSLDRFFKVTVEMP